MGKTLEEIKKGLECCAQNKPYPCNECPYERTFEEEWSCKLHSDALALIQQLEIMAKPNEQIRWERDIAIDQLKQLGVAFGEKIEAQVPRWISVEDEQKPKHGKEYLCVCSLPDDPKHKWDWMAVLRWFAYGTNGFVDRPHFTDEGLNGMIVTHWMELPKLPREAETNAIRAGIKATGNGQV